MTSDKRDIREDLLLRIAERERRLLELQEEMGVLEGEVGVLRASLRIEQEAHGEGVLELPPSPYIKRGDKVPLGTFIMDKMNDREVWTTTKLREAAVSAGLLDESKSPGRSTHGALLGLKKGGKVKMVGKGKWKRT